MAWSTREIAELAGTSLRAVRHYHEVGLLAEPERRSNGYKQYGVAHLVRVLRIKRLTELGFSLPQIADMGDADGHPADALRTLDAELAATVERLQRARVELALILRQSVPTDLPAELAPAAAQVGLSDADRSFIVVMSRVLGPQGLQTWAEMLRDLPDDPTADAFDDLPEDADEATRQDIAARMVDYVGALHVAHPEFADVQADAPRGARFAAQTAGTTIDEVYNSAQRDVLRRLGTLLNGSPGPDRPERPRS
ncbi:MAG: MerR family transcriptional regulator [Pseudonocardia sp.]|nr:MerR family transcriptional regulator [Pseudonocardia sp.]